MQLGIDGIQVCRNPAASISPCRVMRQSERYRKKNLTACTMDCPDACSLLVSVGPDGDISIEGNPGHPVTDGFVCAKIRHHGRRLSNSHRILRPLVKRGGEWRTISWDVALDLCAERIERYRREPLSILYFHGEGAKGVLKQAGRLFFSRLGASRVRGSLCDSAGYRACLIDFGSRESNDLVDILNARAVVNWGKDLSRSSLHLAALVRKARKQGARVITISPGGDGNGPFSDVTVSIRPGTDRFLAAAVARCFVEGNGVDPDIERCAANWPAFRALLEKHPIESLLARCDVTADDMEEVLRVYRESSPVATVIGAGLQRYGFGGENVRFINALALISGNIGCAGGGSYFHLNSLRNLNLSWTKGKGEKTRALRMPLIGSDMLDADDPPIRMLWSDGSNMVNQAPNSGQIAGALDRIPFKVAVDAFMTDTAERADLVLPSTLMLEQEDIVASYMHDYVQYVKAVVDPPGEARSDFRILSDLGKRLSPPVILPDAEDCLRASLDSPCLDVTLEELRERGFVRAQRPSIAYEGNRFDHPDGKYRFPEMLHDAPSLPAEFPLHLLTLVRRDAMHSQILPDDQDAPPVVRVAPDSSALRGIDRQKDVYMVSPLGRMKICLATLSGLHPQVALYRRGDWIKQGGGVNQLVREGLTDMGTGASFYDQCVRLENGTGSEDE